MKFHKIYTIEYTKLIGFIIFTYTIVHYLHLLKNIIIFNNLFLTELICIYLFINPINIKFTLNHEIVLNLILYCWHNKDYMIIFLHIFVIICTNIKRKMSCQMF